VARRPDLLWSRRLGTGHAPARLLPERLETATPEAGFSGQHPPQVRRRRQAGGGDGSARSGSVSTMAMFMAAVRGDPAAIAKLGRSRRVRRRPRRRRCNRAVRGAARCARGPAGRDRRADRGGRPGRGGAGSPEGGVLGARPGARGACAGASGFSQVLVGGGVGVAPAAPAWAPRGILRGGGGRARARGGLSRPSPPPADPETPVLEPHRDRQRACETCGEDFEPRRWRGGQVQKFCSSGAGSGRTPRGCNNRSARRSRTARIRLPQPRMRRWPRTSPRCRIGLTGRLRLGF
jgi:hypothetical protein